MNIFNELPVSIKEAATRITIWMTRNGWKDWELMGVADRNLVTELRKQLAAERDKVKTLTDQMQRDFQQKLK